MTEIQSHAWAESMDGFADVMKAKMDLPLCLTGDSGWRGEGARHRDFREAAGEESGAGGMTQAGM
jgi:hypothetical protein